MKKIEKRIKAAYDRMPAPNPEDILPVEANSASDDKVENKTKKFFRPRLAYAVASFVLIAGIISAGVIGLKGTQQTTDNTVKPGDETSASYNDGVIGKKHSSVSFWDSLFGGLSGKAEFKADRDGESYDGDYDYYEDGMSGYTGGYAPIPSAGLLTASEWSDAKNLKEWLERTSDDEWSGIISSRAMSSRGVIEVSVTSGNGAVYNAKAELTDSDGNAVWSARSNVYGKAYLFYPASLEGTSGKVKVGAEEKDVSFSTVDGNAPAVSFDSEGGELEVKKLDLMLMIDTTGSMGDELEYLKAELSDMVKRVSKSNEALSIRVSVNFYRDEDDDYVVKYFDFRDSVDECIALMKDESAAGGGDYPEAVHTALDNAITGHTWRDDAVKLCYFVLDAPPHNESEIQGINLQMVKSIAKAADLGVRIIPVASSGVDTETEVILRSFAVMTGGTYIYLTNDSGIGGGHLEASVSEKNVEPLNECMIRVTCEYCGIEYVPGNATQEPQEYSISYDKKALANYLIVYPEKAAGGETVEIRTNVPDDAGIRLFANGVEIADVEETQGYMSYRFIMPAGDVEITGELYPLWDDTEIEGSNDVIAE